MGIYGDGSDGATMTSRRLGSIGIDSIDIAKILALYFRDNENSTIDEDKLLLTAELIRLFSMPPGRDLVSQVNEEGGGCFSLSLDLQQFKKLSDIENFFINLEDNPKGVIPCMNAAVHKVLLSQWETNDFDNVMKINIRLHNYPESSISLKNLRAAYIGKLVTVHGTVVKVSTVKPLVTQMAFDCAKCKISITREFTDGKFSPPQNCDSHGCKSRMFTPIRSSAQTIDFQKIRVQELQKPEDHEEGRVPRTVECELMEDLVDTCIPGDVVTVTGIIGVINNYMDIGGGKGNIKLLLYAYLGITLQEMNIENCSLHLLYAYIPYYKIRSLFYSVKPRVKELKPFLTGKSKSKNQGFYYLFIEAVSVKNSKKQSAFESSEDSSSGVQSADVGDLYSFSQRDLEFIVKFNEEYGSDTFRRILHSVCPSIYGHEIVKAGITLSLFGGVRKHSMDRNKVPVRGDIHVIIVGDPGLGKSQLLQAASAISPRGIYVCGNATTKAGLTVAVVKDSMTNDYAFEAGAMVLADGGLCCIDEFDKMTTEHQALLEAMEQQCVSVAKAGLVASLSARTSVIAAANPVGGHYNRAKTVNENLKMSAALLSRFDLVFILLDKPDELLDKQVSEHIMSLHSGGGEASPALKKIKTASGYANIHAKEGSLLSRLRFDSEKDDDVTPIPGQLLRKYVAYARTFVNPKMSKAAGEIIQKFYLKLRDHNTSADCTPITARQLESLVRLAQARARVDLREDITVQDAMDVVEIMKESLYDKFVDEHGVVDFGRSGGMSQQKEAKRFLSALDKQSELQQKDCYSVSEMYSLADRIGLRVPDIDTFLENLNIAGFLLKKGPKTYQVLSSSYSRSQSSRSR